MDILDEKPKPRPETPVNSWEFCKLTGIEPSEGIVIAHFPPKITGLMASGEHYYYAQWINVRLILGDMEDLGTRVIDLLPDPVNTRVKWWKVRDFARGTGYNPMPERWNGAAGDIPDEYFNPEGYAGFRLYSSGPWFWPCRRPEMVLEEDPDEQKMVELAKEYKL